MYGGLDYAGKYAGTGNLAFMLDFRWVRGKNTRGRCLAFKGVGKAPAVKTFAGKKSAGKDPRTTFFYKTNYFNLEVKLATLAFGLQLDHRVCVLS